ncbi:hypothetical protein AAY473_006180 [Plecturocebus cupreus]
MKEIMEDMSELDVHGLTLLPRMECSGTMTPCSLNLLGSSSCPTSLPPSSWDSRHVLIFAFLVEMESCYVAQAGLKLLNSSNPPTPASQSAEITGMHHCAQPKRS